MPRYTRKKRRKPELAIPGHAFLLFIAVVVLLRTGMAARIEDAVRQSGSRFEAALV